MTSAVSGGVKGARPQGPVLLAVDQKLGRLDPPAASRIAADRSNSWPEDQEWEEPECAGIVHSRT
jgi:hypothetical protein